MFSACLNAEVTFLIPNLLRLQNAMFEPFYQLLMFKMPLIFSASSTGPVSVRRIVRGKVILQLCYLTHATEDSK